MEQMEEDLRSSTGTGIVVFVRRANPEAEAQAHMSADADTYVPVAVRRSLASYTVFYVWCGTVQYDTNQVHAVVCTHEQDIHASPSSSRTSLARVRWRQWVTAAVP